MLRPFTGSGGGSLNVGDSFIFDDWSDYKRTNRDDAASHDWFSPENEAGPHLRGMFRPSYRVVAGEVTADNIFENGRLRYGPGGQTGRHEVAVHSPVTTGTWTVNFRFEDETDAGEYWFADLMCDPATGEAWQIMGDDDQNVRLRKRYADGSFETLIHGEWAFGWGAQAVFAETKVRRDVTGEWSVGIDKTGHQGTAVDTWLPTNPQEVRMGSDALPGGTNATENQSSYLHVNADLPYKST